MMFNFDIEHYPAAPKIEHTEAQQQQPALSLTELVSIAQAARPDMDITRFYYPHQYNQPMSFTGQNGSILVRDRANRVYLDPVTGEIAGTQYAGNLGIVARISDTADPLRFGDFSGLTVKLIYAFFGLMLVALVAGGMRMHYLRTQSATQTPPNGWELPAVYRLY